MDKNCPSFQIRLISWSTGGSQMGLWKILIIVHFWKWSRLISIGKGSPKNRAKDDKLLLNDIENDPVGPDAFKEAYFPQVKKNQVAPKPNSIRHFPNTEDDLKKLDEGRYYKSTKSNKRWTEEMLGYRMG